MTTIGLDSSGTQHRARPPISLHPAFPAIVATWFATLLGAGSIVLPAALIEKAVDATGLAALVPAAAPPLDPLARGLIAVALAVAGALAGTAIARSVQRAHDRRDDTGLASGMRRPLRASEELGDDSLICSLRPPLAPGCARDSGEDDPAGGSPAMEPLRFSPPSLARRARSEELAPGQLVERLGAAIEQRRAEPVGEDPAPSRDDIDAALRAALATLRRARGAA